MLAPEVFVTPVTGPGNGPAVMGREVLLVRRVGREREEVLLNEGGQTFLTPEAGGFFASGDGPFIQ